MNGLFALVLMVSAVSVRLCDGKSSEEDKPSQLPVLPASPIFGGKLGNPGAVLRLTKNMLFSDVQKACKETEKKRPEDRSFSDFTIPTADGRFVITRPRITSLTLPVEIGDLVAPNSVTWVANKARMTVYATWSYFSNNNSVNYTGQVYIPPTLFDAAINTTMGRNYQMQPAIMSTSCNVEVGDFKIFFTTPNVKSRLLLDEVQTNITQEIKQTLESDMCDLLGLTIQLAINRLLASFQTRHELWSDPKVILDYSLISDPFVDRDCSVSLWLKGMMTINGRNALTFYPHELVQQNKSSKMIDVLFSDYVLNSLLQSSFQSDLLNYIIGSNCSSKAAEVLQYKCDNDDVCLGKVFPAVVDFPSDWFPELLIAATRPPTAVFQNGSAYLQAYGFMKIDIRRPNSLVRTNLVSLPISVIASLHPEISKDTRSITMEAKIVNLKLEAFHPKQSELVALLKPIVCEILNIPLNRGIPIPMFMTDMIRFHEPKFTLYDRTLHLETDFLSASSDRLSISN